MITIHINGEPRTTRSRTLADLPAELGLPPEVLLIEHNGNALRRADWPTTPLCSGDRIELLRVAAGG
jgi:sulfur carrier protein